MTISLSMGNSHMPETIRKLDARRRAVFPDSFSPGDSFLEEQVDEERVVFRLIRRESPPVVGIKKVNGRHFIEVDVPISTERIARAMREERDAR